MATDMTPDIDEQALQLRIQGKGFGTIADTLGMERAHEANQAFNRALRRRDPAEQDTIRTQENHRLDRLAEAARANETLTGDDTDRRLRTIERLRARLMEA
jgi:hypothetical protein